MTTYLILATNHSTVPVNDGCQVHESMFQSYVGDVRAPHLIAMVDGDAAKQIRKHEVVLARKLRLGFG